MRARAIATRCFCPPLSLTPRSPTTVSNLSGNCMINSYALAFFATSSISSIVAVSLPYLMLSFIVELNKLGSCMTDAKRDLNLSVSKWRKSTPSSVTNPLDGSYKRWQRLKMVDFPPPLLPHSATVIPGLSLRFKPFNTCTSGREGYEKCTPLNSSSPRLSGGSSLPDSIRGILSITSNTLSFAPMAWAKVLNIDSSMPNDDPTVIE
mmetsp:Transcript_34451/g.89202  ORF Transcript_34451/g.89202 Transcript_34451/m.89202 type:complete len:207 (+) Transcript_34451:2340-2960(+)